jgi:signal transduction histidine kinase
LPLHRVPTSVRELLERSARDRVTVHCSDDLVAMFDADRIRQAVDDLVDNALRHGGASVTISAQQENGSLSLEVRDSGSGFPPELLGGAASAKTDGDGRPGLGLALVEAIARAHGGALVLANHPVGGAVATLSLPAPQPARVS